MYSNFLIEIMKTKVIFISLLLLLATGIAFGQNKNTAKSIISTKALIKKYHNQKELMDLQKRELLELCVERVTVLSKTVPYIGLATKSGVTPSEMGIPNNSEYRKILKRQEKSTLKYLEDTANFQRKILPFSDKDDLIATIIFYENILKSLDEFNEK